MKIFIVSAFIFVAGFLLVKPAEVSAATPFNPENKIYVYGKVLAKHTVVINDRDTIVSIKSNTTEDVLPTIYRGKVSKENLVPTSDALYAEYRALVPSGTSRVGDLYEYVPPAVETYPIQPAAVFDIPRRSSVY
jgi:hypothetical protein